MCEKHCCPPSMEGCEKCSDKKDCCKTSRCVNITHVIFDMDGTLLDTEDINYAIFCDIAAKYGKNLTSEIRNKALGKNEAVSYKILKDDLGINAPLEEILAFAKKKNKELLPLANLMPGVELIVNHLHDKGIPIAIATSSSSDAVESKVRAHKDFFDLFHHIVSGSNDPEVKEGKPAPDIFKVCASRFDKPPEPKNCLVFEDSPAGVQGASAAEMHVIMIPDPRLPIENSLPSCEILMCITEFQPEKYGLPAFEFDVLSDHKSHFLIEVDDDVPISCDALKNILEEKRKNNLLNVPNQGEANVEIQVENYSRQTPHQIEISKPAVQISVLEKPGPQTNYEIVIETNADATTFAAEENTIPAAQNIQIAPDIMYSPNIAPSTDPNTAPHTANNLYENPQRNTQLRPTEERTSLKDDPSRKRTTQLPPIKMEQEIKDFETDTGMGGMGFAEEPAREYPTYEVQKYMENREINDSESDPTTPEAGRPPNMTYGEFGIRDRPENLERNATKPGAGKPETTFKGPPKRDHPAKGAKRDSTGESSGKEDEKDLGKDDTKKVAAKGMAPKKDQSKKLDHAKKEQPIKEEPPDEDTLPDEESSPDA